MSKRTVCGIVFLLTIVGPLSFATGLQQARAGLIMIPDNCKTMVYANDALGRVIDLTGGADNHGYGPGYPGPFPTPHGGQGQDNWMDIVSPQSEVTFYALVAYNYWPVQLKSVSFELEGPYKLLDGSLVPGERYQLWFRSTSVTNDTGYAKLVHRMLWPAENPDSITGIWKATAVTSLNNVTISDIMLFYYQRLVYITSVTTDNVCYSKNSCADVSVEYQTHAMQTYPALFSTAITDSNKVPISLSVVNRAIGGATFCTWKTETIDTSMFISEWANTGYGHVHANCYNKDPSRGGFTWCREYAPPPEILIIDSTTVLGDINNDGKVDLKDVYAVAKAYNSSPGQPKWDSRCDINNDGVVDVKDYHIVCSNYGKQVLSTPFFL